MQFKRYISPLALACAALGLAGCGDKSEPVVSARSATTTPTPTPPAAVEFSEIATVNGGKKVAKNDSTRQTKVKITGTVQPFNAKVAIDDKLVKTDAMGYFSKTVKLKKGRNEIELYGMTTGRHDTYEHVTVHRKLTTKLKPKQQSLKACLEDANLTATPYSTSSLLMMKNEYDETVALIAREASAADARRVVSGRAKADSEPRAKAVGRYVVEFTDASSGDRAAVRNCIRKGK